MEVFFQGLKLTIEGMVAAFVVCALIAGLARIPRWMRNATQNLVRELDEDEEIEQVAAVAAAISFTMGNEEGVPDITMDAETDAWARRVETDFPEGGELS